MWSMVGMSIPIKNLFIVLYGIFKNRTFTFVSMVVTLQLLVTKKASHLYTVTPLVMFSDVRLESIYPLDIQWSTIDCDGQRPRLVMVIVMLFFKRCNLSVYRWLYTFYYISMYQFLFSSNVYNFNIAILYQLVPYFIQNSRLSQSCFGEF